MNINNLVKIKGKVITCTTSFGFIKKGDQFYCTHIKEEYFYLFNPNYNYDFKLHIKLLINFDIY